MASGSKRQLHPKHIVLRRTLYGLLVAAPALPLAGCGNSEGCVFGPMYMQSSAPVPPEGESPSCGTVCPEHPEGAPMTGCGVNRSSGSAPFISCSYMTCNNDGRRPEGLQEALPPEACCELGALFAHVAWLEAASVPAFHRLAEELAAHGAPEALVEAARRSAADEVRHTRAMQALAQRHGATMPEVDIRPFEPRTLEAMCLENAVEGCVRETFGALVTGWQARTAQDAEVRRALRPISRDELRHSELAWAVDAWAAGRLSAPERERILQARRETLSALEHEVGRQTPPARLVREAGIPTREQALHLVRGLAGLVA